MSGDVKAITKDAESERLQSCSSELESIIASVDTDFSEYDWNGLNIKIRPLISLDESADLVNSVMRMCVDPTSKLFMPEMLDFLFKINVLLFYTDISLPKNLKKQHTLIYGTSIYEDVLEVISDKQITAMEKCIELFSNTATRGGGH